MKEYRLFYNRKEIGGYNPSVDTFCAAIDHPQHQDWSAMYEDDDGARYAAYARLEDVKKMWPELNKYPYSEPRIFAREVGEWEEIT